MRRGEEEEAGAKEKEKRERGRGRREGWYRKTPIVGFLVGTTIVGLSTFIQLLQILKRPPRCSLHQFTGN